MIALVILEVMLVLGDELTGLAGEQLLRPHVDPDVLPVLALFIRFEWTVSTLIESLLFGRRVILVRRRGGSA